MADYIDREETVKTVRLFNALTDDEKEWEIRRIPSADVAPIRHGHWVFNQEDMTLHCSRCDEVFRFDETEKDECLDFMEYAKYCLACGAVMDEEVD